MPEDTTRRAFDTQQPERSLDRALRTTVRGESTAFGFSIMITVTFGVVQRAHGSPGLGDLFAFALCAVAAFTLVEAFASRGFRRPLPEHRSIVSTLGTAMNFVSVGAAVGAAVGVAELLATDAAWVACPVAAVLVYLAAETAEIVLAERIQIGRGDPDATVVSD